MDYAPELRWKDYLQAVGGAAAREVVVGQPEFFEKLEA